MLVEALLTICSLFIIRTEAIIGSTQNITVIGKVGCGYRAQSNVLIELREYDRFPDTDDVLARVETGNSGRFRMVGYDKEVMDIEPYLRIDHHCVNGVYRKECNASYEYPIPKKYIGRTYNMGIVNLSIVTQKHSIKCFENGKRVYF
ncbi:unnamed protein product [Toxocara canis]|uniref:Transthyretin-like family protein n=1 Tax=Toxocara canis TaxID=6265 RepID=A0A183UUC2_TOXCA|nr:unnamed protein product [Toxocara canis]